MTLMSAAYAGGGAAMIPPWVVADHEARLFIARMILIVIIGVILVGSAWLWSRKQ